MGCEPSFSTILFKYVLPFGVLAYFGGCLTGRMGAVVVKRWLRRRWRGGWRPVGYKGKYPGKVKLDW